ncbi:MarR family transcriptional regulator [Solihabitans fulvus]|uniref:MarR family transcriptional regulator n=1 Tax=Solihabitans fulvus TaxID=1892852 RepID=A0A5B2XS04_9PSEU|nr:MarR family transcriptional regulator [Solihabitans fulvus]KAA2265684.1 MarR family transcriptional regulator [Solihabitans fulvus]
MTASQDRDHVDLITEQWNVERPELDTVPMAVFGRIYRITRLMGDRMDRTYARFGLSRGEFDVLATLRRAGEDHDLSPSQLSTRLMLTTGGMTGRLDKLERAGLVERVPDPTDRRALRVQLTGHGLEVIDEAVVAGLDVQAAAVAALTPEQTAALDDALRVLLAASTDQ